MATLVNKLNREVKVIIPNMREFRTFYSDNEGVIGMFFKRDWEEEKQDSHWKPSEEQPDNEDVDKVAQELYEHLYELKRRNNVPTNLYDKQEIIDLWKAGIVYGRSHPKQEQPEVECEDLEGAAKKYDEAESWRYEALKYPRREAFKAGAEWQKNRLKTNSISAGYNQTDEEYDREMDFATSIIEKEHRQPTFSDAINYGIKLQKAKMMENAVEGEVCILPGRAAYVEEKDNESLKQYLLDHFKYGDKVKIIIVKEEG